VGESMMRHSETMRAASRLLLSHPIVCLFAALAAVLVVALTPRTANSQTSVQTATFPITASLDDQFVAKNSSGYPPSNAASYNSWEDTVWTERSLHPDGNYEIVNGLLRFNTSNLPDDATITGARLQVDIVFMESANGLSLTADWFNWAGSNAEADYSAMAQTGAIAPIEIGYFVSGPKSFELLNASTNISKTGPSSLRLHIDGGPPTGMNYVKLASWNHDTAAEPKLVVNYTTDQTNGGTDPVFVGAGDIASCASSGDEATATLLDNIVAKAPSTTTVYTTGDNAYESGTATEFTSCYNPTWGRNKAITRPTVGNHEYYSTANASGYFGYFGAGAVSYDASNKGYYSYDLGSWHMIALNSNCSFVGGCASGSPQEQWLRADLADHSNTCTLAYWHHPRFSSKLSSGGNSNMKPFWEALYAKGAEVVLNGHIHNYERFAPQTPTGVADPAQGIREFVVGTGGKSLNTFTNKGVANSQVRQANAYGVLKLTLHPTSYDWQFVTAPGGTVADSGSGSCHS
jgi:hypothetical protein